MPKFAANLSLLYPDLPFLDRFEAAARDGFKAVEFLFPYAFDSREIAARLSGNGLAQVLFNLPAGGIDAPSIDVALQGGMRGIACLPAREAELLTGVVLALRYAKALACPRLHMMAGIVPAGVTHADARETFVRNVRTAARIFADEGVELLIEPINLRDMPGYFLSNQEDAHALIEEIGADNVKVQMDLYHCQISEGDLAANLGQYLPTGRVAHIQIAGVPDRHEPDVGEINYPYLFDIIDSLGYAGWIGCEYRPRLGGKAGGTTAGLQWVKKYL